MNERRLSLGADIAQVPCRQTQRGVEPSATVQLLGPRPWHSAARKNLAACTWTDAVDVGITVGGDLEEHNGMEVVCWVIG